MSSDGAGPREVRVIRGKVILRRHARGTKSERDALMLETTDGLLVLRRRGGSAFGETGLEHYLGQTVECKGTILNRLLLVDVVRTVS